MNRTMQHDTCNKHTKRMMGLTCDTLHNTRWEASLVESLDHVQS